MDEQSPLSPKLEYEEMPVVEATPAAVSSSSKSKRSVFGWVGYIILFGLLFTLGIWISTQLRTFVAQKEDVVPTPSAILVVPTIVPTESIIMPPSSPSATLAPVMGWETYSVLNVSYKLPPGVKPPTCDSGCVSQGANLPGGTRFTVAARGKGQQLPDFRNAILTDANGRAFTMSLLKVGDREVYEYVGDFDGSTLQGYSFNKIRGMLVSVNDSLSVEFNHFSPMGKVVDFAADDALFIQIVGSVIIGP